MQCHLPEVTVLPAKVLRGGVLPQDGGQLAPVLPHKSGKVLQIIPAGQVQAPRCLTLLADIVCKTSSWHKDQIYFGSFFACATLSLQTSSPMRQWTVKAME